MPYPAIPCDSNIEPQQRPIDIFFYLEKTKKHMECLLDDMNNFFRQNILREDFIGCSVLASTFLKEKENFALSPIPYIITPSPKKYIY